HDHLGTLAVVISVIAAPFLEDRGLAKASDPFIRPNHDDRILPQADVISARGHTVNAAKWNGNLHHIDTGNLHDDLLGNHSFVRRTGSSRSRISSPTSTKPVTANMMARPGKSPTHQLLIIYDRPLETMAPHSGS